MRYFTKEWYTDTMIADICFQLRKNESAASYSDKFFERLYSVEERAYSKYCKRQSRAAKSSFDKDAVSAEFANNYKENLEFVKANLPEDILADVKDIRVLALGTATNDVATRITRFCGKKNRLCEAAERDYNNASEEADEKVGAAANTLLRLTGAEIIAIEGEGEDIKLTFTPAESEEIKTLTLKNATLLESDGDLCGSAVIKYELLTADNEAFEFSILALSKDSTLLTLSYRAQSVEA